VEIGGSTAGGQSSGRACRGFRWGRRGFESRVGSFFPFPLPFLSKPAPLPKSILFQKPLTPTLSALYALFDSVGVFAHFVYGALANLFIVEICMFRKTQIERGDSRRCGTISRSKSPPPLAPVSQKSRTGQFPVMFEVWGWPGSKGDFAPLLRVCPSFPPPPLLHAPFLPHSPPFCPSKKWGMPQKVGGDRLTLPQPTPERAPGSAPRFSEIFIWKATRPNSHRTPAVCQSGRTEPNHSILKRTRRRATRLLKFTWPLVGHVNFHSLWRCASATSARRRGILSV
jgi:hypothetical protein